ncbi:MAG: hypothetical protein Tsb009_33790 [Planctomycetaceae bacterium]
MTIVHLSDGYLIGMSIWLCAGVLSFWGLLVWRGRRRARQKSVKGIQFAMSLWLVCAMLTGVELYYATIYDQTDSFNISNVSKKWFKLHVEPDQKVLIFKNGKGTTYRDDRPYPESLTPDQHHICFLGDSFTFGHGVPNVRDRFSNRIRAKLNETHPGKFVVSNLADAGKDLRWVELVQKELYQDGRRIDTLIYVLCLNDIETFHKNHDKFYARLGARMPEFFLFRDTYFFNLLYFRARLFTVPEVKDYYSFVSEYYSGEPWQKMQKALNRVHQRCRDHGTNFKVVIFPFLHNLGGDYRFAEAHKVIVKHCRSVGIPVLDLAPVLKPHASEGLSVSRFDDHPNERAHALAADAILKTLLADVVTEKSTQE